MSDLVDIYSKFHTQKLSDFNIVSSDVFSSRVRGITLSEYRIARRAYCQMYHTPSPCSDCESFLKAADMILENGIEALSVVFKAAFPAVTYHPINAKRRLLQMPLVAIRISRPQKCQSQLYLLEKSEGFDYAKLTRFLSNNIAAASARKGIVKEELKELLKLTQSERERKCIRYAVYKASGASPSEARRLFGFEDMRSRALHVEACIKEAEEIYRAVDDLAHCQDQAVLDTYEIESSSVEESSDDETEFNSSSIPSMDYSSLASLLMESDYNWFEFVEKIESKCAPKDLEKFFLEIPNLQFSDEQLVLIVQSHRAFLATCISRDHEERIARSINGEIVSHSESEDCEEYYGIKSVHSEAGKALIRKKRITIKRRAIRLRAKAIAEKRFLSRKVSKRVGKILSDCPNIGETIESFVHDHSVGADAWRRTGVLTFDGNANIKQKVTYAKIQKHLKEVYGRNFAYGTVVQLCVARNKRRLSAKRYRGLAKVTSRRARRGFALKYNPDAHWSCSFYKSLNEIQYNDGRNVLNINRDDATGFRLDTLSTCKQYTNPTLQGEEVKTTRTDFVNRHSSVLQTTSYNFSRTTTTAELCVGVVKAAPIHSKNPAQHFSDLLMLSSKAELEPVFKNILTKQNKEIDCIRVDGATDEGPSHEQVQYFWTEWHVRENKAVTLVTTRSSGSSYLNRVELQNGCLSLGHSNTFIPSTLAGSCIDEETGKISESKLRQNLAVAISAYISRVDGCPCGNTTIKLFEGSTVEEYHNTSKKLEIFLKGSIKQKKTLQRENASLFSHFQKIWDIRNRHMVKGLPSSYVFFLKCCFDPDCQHPVCQSGPPCSEMCWYPGGPPVSHLPLPFPDSARPWGNHECSTCTGVCSGHYCNQLVDVTDPAAIQCSAKPPSLVLKQMFSELGSRPVTDDFIVNAARSVLLTKEETKIWIDHLTTILKNRKRGAAKSAATRRLKQALLTQGASQQIQEEYFCGSCGKNYSVSTEEFWIACDLCEQWYCCICENLTSEPTSEMYLCRKCSNK